MMLMMLGPKCSCWVPAFCTHAKPDCIPPLPPLARINTTIRSLSRALSVNRVKKAVRLRACPDLLCDRL